MVADVKIRERPARRLPAEGEDGLYSQTWYPICLSAELPDAGLVGREFLGGRVIAFRDPQGEAHVLSAYCAHLGVDLACGTVVGDTVRCPYHHFHYDRTGRAVSIGNGEPAPRRAGLFPYPTLERYGIVFAFNGEEPLFDAPRFSLPDDEIFVQAFHVEQQFQVDPYVIIAQTPDLNHTQFLHGPAFAPNFALPVMSFTEYGCQYAVDQDLFFDASGVFRELKAWIHGTNIVHLETIINDMWTGGIANFVVRRPGVCESYGINAVKKADVKPRTTAAMQAVLDGLRAMNMQIMAEDQRVYDNIRFVQGTLLEADRELARYFDYLRRYRRANPGQQFINGAAS